jgi:hypothetical protein
LDGFVAGPNAGPDNALGDGGMLIHRWIYDLEAWRESAGAWPAPEPTRTTKSSGKHTNPPGLWWLTR